MKETHLWKDQPVTDPEKIRFMWAADPDTHTRRLSPFTGSTENDAKVRKEADLMRPLRHAVMEEGMPVADGWKALGFILSLGPEELSEHTDGALLRARR